MRKLLIILLICLGLCSCSKEEETVNYTYEIQSKKVDMSAYEGVNSTNHNFRLILPSELFKAIDAKSSGVFYLGRANCGCCQQICRYINEVAKELNVTVYYIDAYNQEEPLSDEENYNKLFEYMEPILKEVDGEKTLLTPHVFALINGELKDNQVCFDGYSIDTDSNIERFKDVYRKIMKPFSQSN